MKKEDNIPYNKSSIIDYDHTLTPFILEEIQNDAHIKGLSQRLYDVCKYSTEFDKAVAEIAEQIKLRQEQIISAHNIESETTKEGKMDAKDNTI